MSQGFFSTLNPFLHSEMDFEQQKIKIRVNLYHPFRRIARQCQNLKIEVELNLAGKRRPILLKIGEDKSNKAGINHSKSSTQILPLLLMMYRAKLQTKPRL